MPRRVVPASPVRIALVADTHTTRGATEDQPLYKGRLDRAIAAVNEARVDLILHAGDLTQNGKPEEITDYRRQARGFRAPLLSVFGNHDVGNKRLPGRPGGVTAERVARIEAALGPSFFGKTLSGLRVVGINSLLLGTDLPREADQWAFLEKELARPAPEPTLLLTHQPPFLKAADESGGDYWNIEPGPRARLLSLLARGGVRTVLSGHLHRPLTNRHADILYVTSHPVSFGLPRGKQPQGWTLVTVAPDGAVQTEMRYIAD